MCHIRHHEQHPSAQHETSTKPPTIFWIRHVVYSEELFMFFLLFVVFVDSFFLSFCFHVLIFKFYIFKSTDLFIVVVNTLSHVKYLDSFLMFSFECFVLSGPPYRPSRPLGLSACGGRRRCWAVSMMSVRMKCEPLWHHRDLSDVISVSSASVSHIQKNDVTMTTSSGCTRSHDPAPPPGFTLESY